METLEPLDNFDWRSSMTRSDRLLITLGNSIGVHFSWHKRPNDRSQGHQPIIWPFVCACPSCQKPIGIKRRCELLLMVFRGTSLGIFGPPTRIRIMPTPITGCMTSSILIRVDWPFLTLVCVQKPTIIDVVYIQIRSFLGLFSGTPQ